MLVWLNAETMETALDECYAMLKGEIVSIREDAHSRYWITSDAIFQISQVDGKFFLRGMLKRGNILELKKTTTRVLAANHRS